VFQVALDILTQIGIDSHVDVFGDVYSVDEVSTLASDSGFRRIEHWVNEDWPLSPASIERFER